MEVRRAGPEDAAAVAGLITEFFADEGFFTTPETVAVRAPEFLEHPGNAAFLAFDGNAAVGVSTVTTSFGFESGRLAEIEDLYVLPEHRNHGVATALLGESMLWCRQRGFDAIQVVVTPEDPVRKERLIAWYGRLGFVDTGRLLLYFAPGSPG
jgi:aminoglycoside 6'-N-acetyltransferase I